MTRIPPSKTVKNNHPRVNLKTPGNCTNCTVYFETAITPNAATPEPTTPLLIAGGVALLLGIRRKKRSNIV